jgi:serine/threonine protein kinase
VTPPSLAPGTLLATRWIVGGLLGRTEWTEVFEAEETGGRIAGLKLFSATLRSQPKTWEWFEGLNTTLARLPAQAIARVYEVGVEPRLSLGFLAAERMASPNLGRLVTEKGPLSPRVFARSLERIGEALDAVHAERVLHGNLKPQNVFLSPGEPDAARLTDFGGAQLRAGNGIYPALTLGWYAPEIDSGQASPAIDRYALGIVTFFALTGFPWFAALRGQPDGSPVKHALVPAVGSASERAKSFGGALHPAFDAWFSTVLALDPAARFTTSTEMARAFDKAATEAERAVGAAPTVPDSPPLSATMPLARPIDPAVAALAFAPSPAHSASVAPPAGSLPPPGARPSRTPGPVNRRSVVLFAVLGGALVITTLGVLWGLTRNGDEAEAEAASSASAPAAVSAAPAADAPAREPEPAPAPPAASASSVLPKPAPAETPPAPVATTPKAAAPAPKATATAKAATGTTAKAAATGTTAKAAATGTSAKTTAGVKASTSTSTKSTTSKTKKKCGTFLKCK